MAPSPDSFDALRRDFFAGHLAAYPEEGAAIGLHDGDDRLRDVSPDGIARALAVHRDAAARLAGFPEEALSREERLDRWAIAGVAAFEVHRHDDLAGHLRNLELSGLPYAMIQVQIARARTARDRAAIVRRTAAVPRFLAEHGENLARGAASGRGADRTVARYFVEQQLPAIAAGFARLPELVAGSDALGDVAMAAAEATRAHAELIRDRVLPRARDSFAIGEDEYRWRLRHVFGVHATPAELVAEAEDVLARCADEIMALARVTTFAAARAAVARLEAARPASDAEVIPLYQARVERALRFVRERGMVHVPEGFALRLAHLPPAVAELVNATNWPAPLLAPDEGGAFLVAPSASEHPVLAAELLSVHEGVPGHYLQSLVWQRVFRDATAPVRFLRVADDTAAAADCWGPALSIEGWATYAEERMRVEGFYGAPEALYALVVRALRAVRVIVDVGLHTGRMTPEQAAACLVERACVTEDTARRQVLRYQRIPMQAITYLVGALQIEALREQRRRARGAAWDEAAFHDELLAAGPVPAAIVGELSPS